MGNRWIHRRIDRTFIDSGVHIRMKDSTINKINLVLGAIAIITIFVLMYLSANKIR